MNHREETIMEIFWNTDGALTSQKLVAMLELDGWNRMTVFRTIKSLYENGYIKVSAIYEMNNMRGREYVAAMTREEYAAKYLLSKGYHTSGLGDIAVAMVNAEDAEHIKDKEALIEDLEAIIQRLKEGND